MIELVLNLKHHCIETELKRIYERLIVNYFKSNKEKEHLEKRIKLLEKLLRELDFGRLRASYPPLAGGYDEKVVLKWEKKGIFLKLKEEKILLYPFLNNKKGNFSI